MQDSVKALTLEVMLIAHTLAKTFVRELAQMTVKVRVQMLLQVLLKRLVLSFQLHFNFDAPVYVIYLVLLDQVYQHMENIPSVTLDIQSTLVNSKSRGPSKSLRVISTLS